MTNEILTAAAIPNRPARYPNPPAQTYAVYFESMTADGADESPAQIFTYDCTVEIYAPSVEEGNASMDRLRAEMGDRGIHFTTQGWYWLKSVHRYQEIVGFTYIKKT